MQRLQPYGNLKRIYSKSVKPWIIVSAVLTVLAAVASVLQIVYTDNYNILFFIIFPLMFSVVWLTRRNITKKSLSNFSDSGLKRLNDEINSVDMTEGFGVTSEAMAATQNQLFALPINDVVWIYSHVTTGRIMFVPVASSYDIVVVDRNKRRYYLKGKLQKTNQENIINFLQSGLSLTRPGIFYGYSEELNTLFYQSFDRMVEMSDGA